MPHTVTGKIKKQPRTKEGSNSKGSWKMYSLDFTEVVKKRDTNEKSYTNYRAVIFASQNQIPLYDYALSEGKVVSVTSEKLEVSTWESNNGQTYITLEMVDPRLVFFEFEEQGGQRQGGGNGGWGQPQQPKAQPQPPQGQKNFDDDIPF